MITSLYSQELPRYMTEYEKSILKDYFRNRQLPELFIPDPPPTPVRTMAEWEELQAIQITWVSNSAHRIILRQIVDHAQEECLVYIVCSPTNNGNDSNSIKTYLQSGGVPLTNIKFLATQSNSIWCRDYGPWTVYTNVMDTLRIVDWIYNRPRPLDDVIPVFIANYMNVPIHQTLIAPNDLVNTGGNFMTDGHGTGFASKLVLTENGPGNPYGVSVKTESQIDQIMNAYMGINRYIKMEVLPYDQIHHIDMHMKLLDEETLLVGQYPPGIADGPQIEANLQYVLNNFQTCFGKPYKVVRILMPPHNGNYPPVGQYWTYTNSVFVNKTVIVPTYTTQFDTTALRIYREALPGYNIVGINCTGIINSLGAIHCITKEIGVSDPVFISHSAIRNMNYTNQPYEVKAYIKTKSGINYARVYWSIDTSSGFNQLNMSASGDTFRAYIPPQLQGSRVHYYIEARSNSGRIVRKPLPAPRGTIQFLINDPIGISVNENIIPSEYSLKQNYPNPFNPLTNIEFDIPKESFVKLIIYDITGREIIRLVNSKLKAGAYRYKWNASDFTSGIYFCKLETAGYSYTRKMILLK
ncbi:MAG: agmatine deiminase family protein [Ignavibacteria bacterium]|nr:agmatine deiminase family protein [Ignavibacteria bacterium]